MCPFVAQAQVLGDPVDVSHDFQRLENVYFIGSRVTSFDASTGQGTLQWDRYLRNTPYRLIRSTLGSRAAKPLNFPVDN